MNQVYKNKVLHLSGISFFTKRIWKVPEILFFLLLLFPCSSNSQPIERKIIIDHNHYYYTTIDAEFQIATLHTGNLTDPLKMAKNLAIPAGRNYSDPLNPFSWDIINDQVYAINFLNHPLNDRNEALKRFPLSSLSEWNDKITVIDMIMKSVDNNMFAYNDPYMALLKKSNTLNDFFYDGIAMNDTSYFIAIANNGKITLWNYNGKDWTQGKTVAFPIDGYFSLFTFKKEIFLVQNDGEIRKISFSGLEPQPEEISSGPASSVFLIINKDEGTIKYMKAGQLDQNKSMGDQINKKAVPLF
jgi:hypothetical protein